jgi:hypothetical protein
MAKFFTGNPRFSITNSHWSQERSFPDFHTQWRLVQMNVLQTDQQELKLG